MLLESRSAAPEARGQLQVALPPEVVLWLVLGVFAAVELRLLSMILNPLAASAVWPVSVVVVLSDRAYGSAVCVAGS